MGGKKTKPGKGGSIRDAPAFVPSALDINYERNSSRALMWPTPPVLVEKLGPMCPYTLDEIEQRLKNMLELGQITPITVYLTATGEGVVVDGFLRATAMLYAELAEPTEELCTRLGVKLKKTQKTLLAAIPGAVGKVLCNGVTRPKSQADYLALAERNFAENYERKELTPVDTAFYLQRLTKPATESGYGLTREQAADKVHLSKRAADRYYQLLTLPPATLAKVHTGELAMSAALSNASKKGEGTSKGPRPGISLGTARKRFEVFKPADIPTLSEREVLLAKMIAGVEYEGDPPDDLVNFIALLDTKPEKPSKSDKPKKAAPPKMAKKN